MDDKTKEFKGAPDFKLPGVPLPFALQRLEDSPPSLPKVDEAHQVRKKASDPDGIPPPKFHTRKHGEMTVWSCHYAKETFRKISTDYYALKKDPTETAGIFKRMTDDLTALIRSWAGTPTFGRRFILTCPPPGKTAKLKTGYAAGQIAMAVARHLDVEFQHILQRETAKERHGKYASMELNTVPMKLKYTPRAPILIIDDMMTSGATMKVALRGFWKERVPAWGFVWMDY